MIYRTTCLFILSTVWGISLCAQENNKREEWLELNESKAAIYEVYNEAKFGMFIHWGAYSQAAGTWEGEKIPGLGEWIMYHAQIPRAEYISLCKQFNPIKFNAEEWVKLAKDAGMKYVVAMAKHHDGFCLYDSEASEFDIIDQTNFGRDPIHEIYEACKKYDMRMGLYYSHSIDWMDGGDCGYAQQIEIDSGHRDLYAVNTWDPSPVSFEEYLETKAKPQVSEIMTKYPDLIEIWYDFPRWMNDDQSFEFYKLSYLLQPKCLVNSRVGNDYGDYLVAGDNEIPESVDSKYRAWETPGTLNNTWGYKSYDIDWKSFPEVLYWIVEIASKGGNYLLNIGPKGDGSVPRESIDLLQEVGRWMSINGEAIYGTEKWTTRFEGSNRTEMKNTTQRAKEGFNLEFTSEDFWFTTKGTAVYVISLAPPLENKVLIKSMSAYEDQITSIRLLGSDKKIKWRSKENGIELKMPENVKLAMKNGFVLKVEFKKS
jgi:alpha-L-fucosidase